MEFIFLYSLLAAIGISLTAGTLGTFMVWQRLAYFSDTLAHAALLGIAIGNLINAPPVVGIATLAVLFGLAIIKTHNIYTPDTLLTILNSASFAIGVIILSLLGTKNVNIENILLGDILLINLSEVIMIFIVAFITIAITFFRWRVWLLVAINEDIARVEKIKTEWVKMEFLLLLSLFISISVNLVGILLVSALLVIPPSIAKLYSQRPITMLIVAVIACTFSSISGVFISIYIDTQTGPSIIVIAFLYLLLSYIGCTLYKKYFSKPQLIN